MITDKQLSRELLIKDFGEYLALIENLDGYLEFTSRHSVAFDAWEAAAKLYQPRWVYDRMPERDGSYQCRVVRHDMDGDKYECVDMCGLSEMKSLFANGYLICWLQHPEPIDERGHETDFGIKV